MQTLRFLFLFLFWLFALGFNCFDLVHFLFFLLFFAFFWRILPYDSLIESIVPFLFHPRKQTS